MKDNTKYPYVFCTFVSLFHPTSFLQEKMDKTISILAAATAANGLPNIKLLVNFFQSFQMKGAKEDN